MCVLLSSLRFNFSNFCLRFAFNFHSQSIHSRPTLEQHSFSCWMTAVIFMILLKLVLYFIFFFYSLPSFYFLIVFRRARKQNKHRRNVVFVVGALDFEDWLNGWWCCCYLPRLLLIAASSSLYKIDILINILFWKIFFENEVCLFLTMRWKGIVRHHNKQQTQNENLKQ